MLSSLRILLGIIAVLCLSRPYALCLSLPSVAQDVKILTPDKSYPIWAKGSWRVTIDVRTVSEYTASHLPGSYLAVDMTVTKTIPDAIIKCKFCPIAVYSTTGFRSALAAQDLVDAGFEDVTNIQGLNGLFSYKYPKETGFIAENAYRTPSCSCCDDKGINQFTFKRKGVSKNYTCVWLSKSKKRTKRYCRNRNGWNALQQCPSTCKGACGCNDKTNTFPRGKKTKKCGWVKRQIARDSGFCGSEKNASMACPDTCNGWCSTQ